MGSKKTRRWRKRNPYATQLRSAANAPRIIPDKRKKKPKYKDTFDG